MAAAELTKTVLKDNANLKAYYRFEGNSTDTMGVNNGTDTAITYNASYGKYDQGASFNGTSSIIALPKHANTLPTGNFTICAWVKTSSGSDQMFYDASELSGNYSGIQMRIRNTGKLFLFSANNTGTGFPTNYYNASGNTALNDGNWHHIAGTYDGAYLRVWLDGKMDGSAAYTNNPAYDASITPAIGIANGYAYFSGSMDEFAIFSTALSADQIKELYEGRFIGEAYPQSGLVAGYHLNGSSTDFSGNNNHGTDTAITYSQANGKFGKGADFNGSTGFIQLPNISATLGTLSAFSISFWLNADNKDYGAGEGKVIDIRGSGTGYIIFRVTSTNFNWYLYNGTEAQFNYARVVGSWVHIAYVYDGSNLIGYLNGNRVGSASRTGTVATGVSGCFGREYNASAANQYDGKLDEVLIFNRALTPQEIRRMYALGVGKLY